MAEHLETFMEHYGGKLDRLIADCFNNLPLRYEEAIHLINDATESICNSKRSFLDLPTGIKDDFKVYITANDLGLIFTSPKNPNSYAIVKGEYNWPSIKTDDQKWQAFIQRSPLWKFFDQEIKSIENTMRPDLGLSKNYKGKDLAPTLIATLINYFGKPCWKSPIICTHMKRFIAEQRFGTIDKHTLNSYNSMRISPGNPNAKFDCQKTPYVKLILLGQHYDINGRPVDNESEESHIDLSKCNFQHILEVVKTNKKHIDLGCSCLNMNFQKKI